MSKKIKKGNTSIFKIKLQIKKFLLDKITPGKRRSIKLENESSPSLQKLNKEKRKHNTMEAFIRDFLYLYFHVLLNGSMFSRINFS